MSESCKAAALFYAGSGWRVIPLNGKIPLTSHGSKDGTTNSEIIERWWDQWPQANVGICTGPESGLLVIDVDPRNGGTDSVAALCDQHGRLQSAMCVATGGGGYHLYYSWPKALDGSDTRKQLAEGVDVKGRGGYVVAPPSVHETGARYSWSRSSGIGTPPPWVAQMVRRPVEGVSAGPGPAPASVPEGKRNETLFSVGAMLRRVRQFDQRAIAAMLEGYNRTACSPPLPTDEIQRIAHSVMRYSPVIDQVPQAPALSDEFPTPRTLAHHWDYPPEAPPAILGSGVFSEGDWMLFHAREGLGKTWALAQLTVSLASGRPWYGIETHDRRPVALLSLEMSTFELARRATMIVDREGWDADDRRVVAESIHLLTRDDMPFANVEDPAIVEWMSEWLIERGIRVLILDPMSQFFEGDETREGLRGFIRFLTALHGHTGTSVVLAQHDRKSSTLGDQGDHASAARGSVALIASARASFRLHRPGEDSPTMLVCDKASNAPKPETVWLRHDAQWGGMLVSADAPASRGERTANEIVAHIASGVERTAKEIAEALGMSDRAIRSHLKALEEAGKVYFLDSRDSSTGKAVRRYGAKASAGF